MSFCLRRLLGEKLVCAFPSVFSNEQPGSLVIKMKAENLGKGSGISLKGLASSPSLESVAQRQNPRRRDTVMQKSAMLTFPSPLV